jgi:hypothetical protein
MMKFIALVAALACSSAHADRLGLLRIGSREATLDVQRSLFEEDSSLYVVYMRIVSIVLF